MVPRKSVLSSAGPVAVVMVAALALTAAEPSVAFANSAPAGKGPPVAAANHADTDFSSARRRVRARRGGGGGGAAAAAAFAGIVGTGLAIAAAQNRRDYYDNYDGYYGGGPVYYGGGPYYGGYRGYRSGVPHFRGHPLAGW
ncbi:hypothetical protein [Bradyrhizobium sp. dw_78]|uniref:hypothetical protein n=1 Tax=Bradyrhizobium sp. dw_78 TaxID=2719793 RepID=UPI001BD38A07|nr:hypothetical protein [Bradyrhizobium sp. dw_78]